MSDNHVSPEVAAAEPAAQREIEVIRLHRIIGSLERHLESSPRSALAYALTLALASLRAAQRNIKELQAALRVDPQAETPAIECSLWAHYWLMGNVNFTVKPKNDARCVCDRVAWSEREKLIAVRTGYKTIYGSVEAERQGVAPPPDPPAEGSPQKDLRWAVSVAFPNLPATRDYLHDYIDALFVKLRAAKQDLPTDVDTLRRLRERVDAALDEKYTRVAEARHRCADCGAALNAGEAKCFTVCDACWAKAYPPSGAAERSPAPTWQTIDSAPKDGRWFLGWNSDCGCFVWRDGPGLITGEDPAPTHWMPLPSPPSAGSEASKT